MKNCLIVGAGFSGAVLARELAERLACKVKVIDCRNHVAGNCHTERDQETGVMVHKYGPHIFHTDREEVWDYVRRFGEFAPFVNRVKASITKGVFSLPVNLHTINQFFGENFNPGEAREFLAGLGDRSIDCPQNFEEQALKFLGRDLYEAFFEGYTLKQWGCSPKELPASILKRLPVRFNYNDSYYNSRFQGIPVGGYSAVVTNILDHPDISVELGKAWTEGLLDSYEHVFFTGPIDQFFNYSEGRLSYRTVYWDKEVVEGDYQGNAVINYPDKKVPHTRVHEHKHFAPWEEHEKSVVFTEYSKETEEGDIPYYPKRLEDDIQILGKYRELGFNQAKVSFLGRLATYRYMDMHQVIGEALDFAASVVHADSRNQEIPSFSGE